MTGPVNVKTISALNVKSGRSGKFENNSTLNVKKSLVSCMTSQMVSLDNGRLGNFFGIFGFRGVNNPKVKSLGKCHDLEIKCKIVIQEWAGRHFLGVLDVKNRGVAFGGFMGSKIQKYI